MKSRHFQIMCNGICVLVSNLYTSLWGLSRSAVNCTHQAAKALLKHIQQHEVQIKSTYKNVTEGENRMCVFFFSVKWYCFLLRHVEISVITWNDPITLTLNLNYIIQTFYITRKHIITLIHFTCLKPPRPTPAPAHAGVSITSFALNSIFHHEFSTWEIFHAEQQGLRNDLWHLLFDVVLQPQMISWGFEY